MKSGALILALALAFIVSGCGDSGSSVDDSSVSAGGLQSGTSTSSQSESPSSEATDVAERDWTGGCPFTQAEVETALGTEVTEVEPEQDSLGTPPLCEFETPGVNPGESRFQAIFTATDDSVEELADTCDLFESDPGAGTFASRSDWGSPACQILFESGGGSALFISSGTVVTVGVILPSGSEQNAQSALDQLVRLTGPDS